MSYDIGQLRSPVSLRPPWLLAVITGVVLAFLLPQHDYASMTAEGFPEFQHHVRGLLGLSNRAVPCALELGRFQLPLALTPYIGGGYMYGYAPAAYLWLAGVVSDPYVYRYTGIVLFAVAAWLSYYVALLAFGRGVALFVGVAFITCPVLMLISLVEGQTLYVMLVPLLSSAMCFLLWLRNERLFCLFAAAFAAGLVATTRLEGFAWPLVTLALYAGSGVAPRLKARLWESPDRWKRLGMAASGLGAGGSMVLAYNLICPADNVIAFLWRSLRHSGGTRGEHIPAKVLERFDQFWSHCVLHLWRRFEMPVENLLFAAIFLAAVAVLGWLWVSRGDVDFSLFALLIAIPLSVYTTGVIREEHLQLLLPLPIFVVAAALARSSRRAVVAVVTVLVAMSNVYVTSADWRRWRSVEHVHYTLLNAQNAVVLVDHLLAQHPEDDIILTNVAYQNFVDWVGRGSLRTHDLTGWEGEERFVLELKAFLRQTDRTRVFVIRAPEFEQNASAVELPRSNLLKFVLREQGVLYQETRLATGTLQLYDVLVVPPGVGPSGD
jgi:hypothetical protein